MAAPAMTRAQLEQHATQIAKEVGVPPAVFRSLITHESGWDTTAKSPVDAGGLTQLMPATAKGLGVTDVNDPIQNMRAGARYLKMQLDRFGSIRLALAAYNAGPSNVERFKGIPPFKETQRYVRNVMRDAIPDSAPVEPSAPRATSPLATPTGLTAPPPPGMSTATSDPLGAQVFQNLGDIGRGESPTFALSKLAGIPPTPTTPMPGAPLPVGTIPKLPAAPRAAVAPNETHGISGQISIAQGANIPGRPIVASVLDFVKKVAGVWGHEVTITSGTTHGKYVAGTNRVSQHYTGHAVDIATSNNASGHIDQKLVGLGQAALIAAGMPEAEARKHKGGLFNIGRYQIIFNTDGPGIGNHYNHLHIGVT